MSPSIKFRVGLTALGTFALVALATAIRSASRNRGIGNPDGTKTILGILAAIIIITLIWLWFRDSKAAVLTLLFSSIAAMAFAFAVFLA